jgi:predicted phosphodiesterase
MKFIHFGCWNEFGYKMGPSTENPGLPHSALTYTIDQLNKYVNKNKTDFLIIAGDNFYPSKTKDNKEELESKKIKNKVKTVVDYNHDLFISGFEALPKIPKYLIFGNHDIEDQIKLNKPINNFLFPNLNDTTTTNCKILNLQQFYTSNKPEYTVFNEVLYRQYNSTLIIMLDSNLLNLYGNSQQDLGCYKYLFDNFIKSNPGTTIDQLIKHQIDTILKLINSKSYITNYIFVGHHPIFTYKHKDGDNGERKLKTESHFGLLGFFSNHDLIKLLSGKNITYLCADLHLFQFGIVNIGPLTIKQYVVGTGGAHQDTYDFKESSEQLYTNIDQIPGYNYRVIENYNKIYGFLVVDIQTIGTKDIIKYTFNPVDFNIPSDVNLSLDLNLALDANKPSLALNGGDVVEYIDLI